MHEQSAADDLASPSVSVATPTEDDVEGVKFFMDMDELVAMVTAQEKGPFPHHQPPPYYGSDSGGPC